MDKDKLIKSLRYNELDGMVDTRDFADVLRPVLLSAIYQSAESFAFFATIENPGDCSKAEIKSQATAAKAYAENAKLGFKLLRELDELKPSEVAEIVSLIPKTNEAL